MYLAVLPYLGADGGILFLGLQSAHRHIGIGRLNFILLQQSALKGSVLISAQEEVEP